jgi:D-inositol-3-phosphate glycosyltransferase
MMTLHTGPLDQPGAGASGGMNVYVRDLSQALAQLDIAVDVYTRSDGGLDVVEDVPGVRVFAIPAGPRGPASKGQIADMVPALISSIEAARVAYGAEYDLVHSHYWISGLAGQRLAARWHVPHVQMFHTFGRIKTEYAGSPLDPRRDRAEMRLLKSADAVVVSNTVERAQVMEHYGMQGAPLVTIPCGIDVEQFRASRERAESTLPLRRRFRVVALGRLERLKNFALLLEGVALAGQRDQRFAAEVEVLLAGGPSEDEPAEATRLRALTHKLGLQQVVRFVGAVPRDDIPRLYAEADVCVVSSLHESFGLVALEAMASGVPVVATRTGGMRMTVVNGVSGYLVDPRDPADLAERLLALWESPMLRRGMAVRGARTAQHYAWPTVAERVSCLYEAVMAGTASRGAR